MRHNCHIPALKQFLLTLWLLAATVFLAAAASPPTDGKPALPDDLRFDFKPVPAEQNAIINWRRAAELEVMPDEHEKLLLTFAWTPGFREPSQADLDDLQHWIKRNQDALSEFSASLGKPQAQWPERNPQNKQPEITSYLYLSWARLFTADQLAGQKKYEAAANILEENLKLARLGTEGDPTLFHYLVACRVRSHTQDAILRLAARKDVPLPLLTRLLDDLPVLKSETNVYSKILRVEFTRDYNAALDIKELAAVWAKISQTNAAWLIFPEECRRMVRVLLDPTLVSFHPKPYDFNSDLEETIRHYRIYRANVCSPWSDHSDEVDLESEESRTNLMQEAAPLMTLVKNEPLPLSRQAAQKARAAYLAIKNPVGRGMDCSIMEFMDSDTKVFQARTERESTRAVLALLVFQREKGLLPGKLSDLVDAKILATVPCDPFSDKPLQYSRERQLLWSVSYDGESNDGKAGKFRWSGADAVWEIPKLN